MAAIQFPNNPNAGDLFTASNGIRYTYDGEKWKTLGTSTVGTEGQFVETPIELTIDKVIPGNTNTGAVGSLAVGAGVTLTVPSTSSFRTLSGKTGTYGVPETGGTFTGPVSFDDNTIIKGNSNDGSGALTLNCENNSHGIKIKGPPHSAGANYTLVLPNDTGTSGQALTTNGSGVSSWLSVLPLTGGTVNGQVVIGGDANNGTAEGIQLNSSGFIQISRGSGVSALWAGYTQGSSTQTSRINNNGNAHFLGSVGIGTDSPGSFSSGANTLVVGTVSGNAGITINNDAADQIGSIFFAEGSGATGPGRIRYEHANNAMAFSTSNTERMRIDSSGNVGIGTSSPGSKLEVHSSGSTNIVAKSTHGNGGYLNYSGLASNGAVTFSVTHNGSITAEDLTINNNVRVNNNLAVYAAAGSIYEGYSTSSGSNVNTFMVTADGSATFKSTVNIEFNSSQTTGLQLKNAATGTAARIYYGSSIVGSITNTTSATAFNTSSDYRLKENVVDITNGITRVKQLQPKRFNFIADADTTVDGFLAHEAQAVVPEAVTGEKDGEEMQGIDQAKLVPLLTAALQEAIAKIETLEQRLSDAGIA